MTLIIGVKCADGVVMGADGAATLGTVVQSTVRQPIKKLSILRNTVIIGVSGPVGLGQRIQGAMEALWDAKSIRKQRPSDAMTLMRTEFFKHVGPELQAAAFTQQLIGPVAQKSALTGTLVALPINDQPTLFQFDQQCAPEEATIDLPFAAIGVGQSIADPFLAFLRRIFWPGNRALALADGIFAVLWTLDNSIQITPGGIADPVQIVVLERQQAGWSARELNDTELQEHRQAIGEAEKSLKGFRESLQPGASGSAPQSPLEDVVTPSQGSQDG